MECSQSRERQSHLPRYNLSMDLDDGYLDVPVSGEVVVGEMLYMAGRQLRHLIGVTSVARKFMTAHFYGKLRSVAERRRAKDAIIAEQTGPAYPSGMYPASFTPQ